MVVRALDKLYLLREGTTIRSWLFTIMHNLHVNEMRRRSRALDSVSPDAAAPRAEPAGQDAAVEWSELFNALAARIDDEAGREALVAAAKTVHTQLSR